ncbi:response regulator transcription factor [Lacticaseibacillus pantheris]|jgi:NarL family two-component system response regulator LiaR|uniref:DNA-binding response regulator n=1 Tax=Lacticaseibacillus pantheris DSM 15945 = JCM 12539 = NBRC 106106 TaxID=1423783 RepID=A0A0R1U0M1_9LACO|nr:response regulator transcription factor [Lacticaseibacillus pantheris]KRL86854.1 DNA-binding response regulator [Lacticaseibacillus pantheris DSM 15945 = JCM 12539 = NBRC 106106]WKF86077.1 response regulator transcription factor [Lacticaseibacillus pantheris]
MIKVLIVDDHEMVRLGISSYLGIQQDIEVIGEAENGADGRDQALADRPDVILMDLKMPKMDGVTATKEILASWPQARVIILTSFIDDELVYPAMAAGAAGYILKTSTAAEIADAIRNTMRGQSTIAPEVNDKLQNKDQAMADMALYDDLTSREREVLDLIAQGKSNQQIADELFITLKTVKTHVSNILAKLEVDDRTKAALYAVKHGKVSSQSNDIGE